MKTVLGMMKNQGGGLLDALTVAQDNGTDSLPTRKEDLARTIEKHQWKLSFDMHWLTRITKHIIYKEREGSMTDRTQYERLVVRQDEKVRATTAQTMELLNETLLSIEKQDGNVGNARLQRNLVELHTRTGLDLQGAGRNDTQPWTLDTKAKA